MKKENDLVNIIKFIACFFIVLLHVIDKYDPGNYLLELGRFGVPFFLMISGYYAYKSNKKDNLDNAKKQLFKVLKITLIILICYSLFNCINSYFINNHDPLYWITHHLNSKKALSVIKCIKIKIIVYFCSTFIFFLFFWYACAAFCAVYPNTQGVFVGDSYMSFLMGLLYPFALYLIPAGLRYLSLRAKKHKNIKILYSLSDKVPFF